MSHNVPGTHEPGEARLGGGPYGAGAVGARVIGSASRKPLQQTCGLTVSRGNEISVAAAFWRAVAVFEIGLEADFAINGLTHL